MHQIDEDDAEFGDVTELSVSVGGLPDARWERVRNDIDIREVLYLLHNRRGNPVSCPFHGRDSKPSFNIYRANNTAFCFGCPEEDGFWDNVKIVSRTLDISRTQALHWLEKEFGLADLGESYTVVDVEDGTLVEGDEVEEPEEIDPGLLLDASDLQPGFLRAAPRFIQTHAHQDEVVSHARTLLETYFTALKLEDPLPLARFLGASEVRNLIQAKQGA